MGEIKVKRLHHNAYPVENHEATRHFYEDIIGLPLVAAWAERAELYDKEREFMHTFYALADGSALAFFQMATKEDQEEVGRAVRATGLDHIALAVDAQTQDEIKQRLESNGYRVRKVDHGYVVSIYAEDPDGLNIEFTVDAPNADEIAEYKRERAHAELKTWMAGDHTPNNDVRPR